MSERQILIYRRALALMSDADNRKTAATVFLRRLTVHQAEQWAWVVWGDLNQNARPYRPYCK